MTSTTAFIGDVHGNLDALQGIFKVLAFHGNPHTVFLGDYINKGAQSAGVIEKLIEYSQAGRVTLLAGNHETALLKALDTSNLTAFLKMGGAATIRSYVGGNVDSDVLENFRHHFPQNHLDAIRGMHQTHDMDDVIARHILFPEPTTKFQISAHVPTGELPRIGQSTAQLDTGCGTEFGRLTALLWPSLDYFQVDAGGSFITKEAKQEVPPSQSIS